MGDFIKNSPFRFWCQKVLPLVYDDSLSYYELLCKVVGKLNELAENQNNLSDEIKAVAKDLNDFKTQVPGMIETKVEEWLNNYITTHGLVNSVNGMTGAVTLTASDVGAIANVNGSVKNNNIADGAVTSEKIADGAVTGDKIAGKAITANKLADGVIPEKLPNPQKLTFTGAVTGEYDGSQAVNIDIPAGGGGGGGGAVDSVNGMTGAVVLKKLTAGEGLSMSGADGYNGSAEQTIEIAPGTIPTKLPNPHKLIFTGAVAKEYDGSQEVNVNIPSGGDVTELTTQLFATSEYNWGSKVKKIQAFMVNKTAYIFVKIVPGKGTVNTTLSGIGIVKLPTPSEKVYNTGVKRIKGSFVRTTTTISPDTPMEAYTTFIAKFDPDASTIRLDLQLRKAWNNTYAGEEFLCYVAVPIF